MDAARPLGPWNPGIESPIPAALVPLCTVFRAENVATPFAQAQELASLTGLPATELVAFRPERLALHELLIRITADLCVPAGERIEDLGINFRAMTRDVLVRYLDPRMGEARAAYRAARDRLAALIAEAVGALDAEGACRTAWEANAHRAADPAERAAWRALARAVSALLVRHGRVWGGRELVQAIALDLAANEHCSEAIGRWMEPLVARAVEAEGYRVLPPQEQLVVMNTKGPSASGKSTLRPLQRGLARDIGLAWEDFALISPDIWRKQFLDYASLGDAYRYAGAFTGDELRIVDQKLDRYMARKAERAGLSHLLIDRFRFDSFAPDSGEAGSNLLTRFGRVVYLFFMVTPPASLVERAWNRGEEVGRYKPVDDTLAHAVEAYSGMPQLFFTWMARADKQVHCEFLDNSVRLGERPRTVAFGWNERLNVLDVKALLDVQRYRRVNVDAASPAELYPDLKALAAGDNLEFLRECVRRLRLVQFADQATGRLYLRVEAGRATWVDRAALDAALMQPDTRAALAAVVPRALDAPGAADTPRYLRPEERVHTLGDWGWKA